ncbi:GtrA family protein [Candidatus Peregrinibacteria bacterium]|nr:GtrA family protein [Candidatus Peregrinibacteria bacterium]
MRYLMSGGLAVALDFGGYFVLLWLDVYYVTANIVGNILGFFGAFLLHKYFVFGKHDAIVNHFVRYCVINIFNLIAQTALLFVFVEYLHLDEGSAKFISWALTVLWNFFLYKFLVYV